MRLSHQADLWGRGVLADLAVRDPPFIPIGPFGPTGPCLPGDPAGPVLPLGPGIPWGPRLPRLPVLPFGPGRQSFSSLAQI